MKTKDFIKGLILAIIVAILSYMESVFTTGNWDIKFPSIVTSALTGFVGYLIKNLATNAEDTHTFGIPHNISEPAQNQTDSSSV